MRTSHFSDDDTGDQSESSMQSNRVYIIGLFILIVTGGLMRAVPAFDHPLWYDEADTWQASVMESSHLNDAGFSDESPMPYKKFFLWTNHFETAPLTFLLTRISTDLFGTDAEWAMRMPSLIASVLCIPLMFLLGHIVYSKSLGLIGAALMAFDPNMVDQGMQARMYSVLMLLLLATLCWSIHLLRDPWRDKQSRRVHPLVNWIGLGVALGLLLSTSQFTLAAWVGVFVAVVAVVAGGVLLKVQGAKPAKTTAAFAAAYVIGLLISIVGVTKLFERVLGGGGSGGDGVQMSFIDIAKEIVVAAKDLIGLTPAGLIVYVFAAVGLFLLLKKCKTSLAVLVGVAVLNVLILFPFRKMHHFMDSRYLLILEPTLFIGMGMLVVGLRRRAAVRKVCVAMLVAYIGLQAWQSTHLELWRPQPDRYIFAREMNKVRERIIVQRNVEGSAQESSVALMHPGVAMIMGQYYEVPQDKALFESVYDKVANKFLDDAKVPKDLGAQSVWLIMGMNNWEVQLERAQKPLNLLAAHYGVAVDESMVKKHFKRDHVIVAQVSKAGIVMESYSVQD